MVTVEINQLTPAKIILFAVSNIRQKDAIGHILAKTFYAH